MSSVIFHDFRKRYYREYSVTNNAWSGRGRIPVGTLEKPSFYEDEVPDSDIVTQPFEPPHIKGTNRNALNGLVLASSGKGKSLHLKNDWFIQHESGVFCVFFDSKGTTSGRAKIPATHGNIPKGVEPKGIELSHYVPAWLDMGALDHHFKKYSLRLKDINESIMWQNLGMSSLGADKVSAFIQDMGDDVTFAKLILKLEEATGDKDTSLIDPRTYRSIRNIFENLILKKVISDEVPEIDFLKEVKEGKSVCISYNNENEMFIRFDIGCKIKALAKLKKKHPELPPIKIYLDDSGVYADSEIVNGVKNFAVHEIENITNLYRSDEITCKLATQGLGIISKKMLGGFNQIIIYPSFNGSKSQLKLLDIPEDAIDRIESLEFEKNKYCEVIVIDIDHPNDWTTCYLYLPSCNHFQEVYYPKGVSA